MMVTTVDEILKDGGEPQMNKQENEDQIFIEDLPVNEAQQDKTKGGGTGATGVGILKSTDGGRTW
jgi:hypothetical protein